MKHPDPEAWLTYVYGETDRDQLEKMRQHLSGCPECLALVGSFQGNRREMDSWELPPSVHASRRSIPAAPLWAAAAILMISCAFFLGRMNRTDPIDQEWIVTAIRTELQKEQLVLAERQKTVSKAEIEAITTNLEALIDSQGQQTQAAILQLQEMSRGQLNRLRQELQTVAVVGEGRHQVAQQQFTALGLQPSEFPVTFAIQAREH